jgi:hypothetical protein
MVQISVNVDQYFEWKWFHLLKNCYYHENGQNITLPLMSGICISLYNQHIIFKTWWLDFVLFKKFLSLFSLNPFYYHNSEYWLIICQKKFKKRVYDYF